MLLAHKDLVTIAKAIQSMTTQLNAHTTTPRLDAELLLADACKRPRSFLYAYPEHELTIDTQTRLQELLLRRIQGEPIAYLLGQKEFWSLPLNVTPDTLIPRPETEHIIEWALNQLPYDDITIADLGTGSGAIAIALAHERPSWSVHATDLSAAALQIAIQNARQHKLDNIEFYMGSWLDALPDQHYTAIISNPPYIANDDPHLTTLSFEPQQALRADDNGFAAFKKIIADANNKLLPNGKLILEHGYNQADALAQLLYQAGFIHIESYCDLAKQTRFIVASKKS